MSRMQGKMSQRGYKSDKVPDFVAKNSTHSLSPDFFFRDIFSSGISCARVATRVIFQRTLATGQIKKKSHHHRKQKIARVAAAQQPRMLNTVSFDSR